MPDTQFTLTQSEKVAWSKEAIKAYREKLFFKPFIGNSTESIIQQFTELDSNSVTGGTIRMGLVDDLGGTGKGGDSDIEDASEAMTSSELDILIDTLSHSTMSHGRLEDKRAHFNFREQAKDKLGRWMAKAIDELMFNTLYGTSYALKLDGSARVVPANQDAWTTQRYAADVSAATAGRHFNWTGTALVAGDTTTVTTAYTASYKMLLKVKAKAHLSGIKPLIIGGKEFYAIIMHPDAFTALKLDADFRANLINGLPRSGENPIFTGADEVTMDGLIIYTHRNALNTTGVASGSKWGVGGLVEGSSCLVLGVQALGYANIYGKMKWDEKLFNFDRKTGIAVSMMFGMRKTKFKSEYNGNAVEDFGALRVNIAI